MKKKEYITKKRYSAPEVKNLGFLSTMTKGANQGGYDVNTGNNNTTPGNTYSSASSIN